jgi:hypothetical protein
MPKSEMSEFLGGLCGELRSAAQSWKMDAGRSWPSSSTSDREMRAAAAADAKAIRAVAALVKSGQVFEAYERASCLDTVVREAIPPRFWDSVSALARHRLPS